MFSESGLNHPHKAINPKREITIYGVNFPFLKDPRFLETDFAAFANLRKGLVS